MGLLCDMPTGPHNADKERLLCALAASVDYHPEDTRRHHHMKEAVVFMIKHTRPGDFCGGTGGNEVRLRLCPACYYATPSRLQCAGRSSFHVASSEGQDLKRKHPWKSQFRTLHRLWRRQQQQYLQ